MVRFTELMERLCFVAVIQGSVSSGGAYDVLLKVRSYSLVEFSQSSVSVCLWWDINGTDDN